MHGICAHRQVAVGGALLQDPRAGLQGLRPGPHPVQRHRDLLEVKNEGGEFQVEVLALSLMRGPAAVAQTLYSETESGKAARLKAAAERKAMQEFAPLPERRPSKRDRRRIIQFRGGA